MCRGWASIDDGDARLKHALEETSKLCIGSPSAACFFFNAYSSAGMQALSALCIRSFDCFLNETSCHRKIQGIQRDSREHSQNEVEKRLVIFSSVQSISPRPILLAYQKYHLQIQLSFSHLACQHMIHLYSFDAMFFLFWVSVWCVLQPPHGSSCRSTSSFASPHRSCLRKFVRTGTLDWLLRQLDLPKGNRSGSFQTCKKQTKQDIQGHIPTNKPSCPCPCHSFHESLLQRHGNGFSHFLSKWKSQNVDKFWYKPALYGRREPLPSDRWPVLICILAGLERKTLGQEAFSSCCRIQAWKRTEFQEWSVLGAKTSGCFLSFQKWGKQV